MVNLRTGIFAGLALLCLAACGGNPNQSACENYVTHVNGLSCVDDEMSVGASCPETLDTAEYRRNCEEFFACAETAASCDDQGNFVNSIEADCPEGCTP